MRRQLMQMGRAIILLDGLIGEYAAMTRIAEIHAEALSGAPSNHRPLIDLRAELGIEV